MLLLLDYAVKLPSAHFFPPLLILQSLFCSGSRLDFIPHQVEFYSGSSLVAWQNALRDASFISVRVKRQSTHFPGEVHTLRG